MSSPPHEHWHITRAECHNHGSGEIAIQLTDRCHCILFFDCSSPEETRLALARANEIVRLHPPP